MEIFISDVSAGTELIKIPSELYSQLCCLVQNLRGMSWVVTFVLQNHRLEP